MAIVFIIELVEYAAFKTFVVAMHKCKRPRQICRLY